PRAPPSIAPCSALGSARSGAIQVAAVLRCVGVCRHRGARPPPRRPCPRASIFEPPTVDAWGRPVLRAIAAGREIDPTLARSAAIESGDVVTYRGAAAFVLLPPSRSDPADRSSARRIAGLGP